MFWVGVIAVTTLQDAAQPLYRSVAHNGFSYVFWFPSSDENRYTHAHRTPSSIHLIRIHLLFQTSERGRSSSTTDLFQPLKHKQRPSVRFASYSTHKYSEAKRQVTVYDMTKPYRKNQELRLTATVVETEHHITKL